MKNGLKFTLSLTSLLTASTVQPGNLTYYADFDHSVWEVESSVFECRMSQKIPHFGAAVFSRGAGESMIFSLQALQSDMAEGPALLTSNPPVWRQDLQRRNLGYVDIARSETPLVLDVTATRVVLNELFRGMMPTLTRRAWYNEVDLIEVAISPVNFQGASGRLQECLSALLPVNFSQIERSTVFWRPSQLELDAAARAMLDNVIAYIKADASVISVQINGFSDTVGSSRDNLENSRLRAFAVHEYLVRRGIDEAMLETRYFGEIEEYLIVRNERTAADRDRNRRVTLLLRRR
jgi:outer membrane protein OmpA-like peptidoglycan-associated protein